jgi:hypothetical protein
MNPHLKMRADKSYLKPLLFGGILFGLLVLFVVITDAKGLRHGLPYLFLTALIPTLAACAWSLFSRKTWSMVRHAFTVFVFFLVYILIRLSSVWHDA